MEEGVEGGGAFGGEVGVGRGEAVLEGVLGDAAFARGSAWAGGFAGVAAVGGDAARGAAGGFRARGSGFRRRRLPIAE